MVDAWTGPTPNAQQFPSEPTDAIAKVLEKIERQKFELDEMRNNLLSTAGISVEPGVFRVLGNMAIEGTLSLPNGIIDNDALASPFRMTSTWDDADGFSTPGGVDVRNLTLCTVTIPAGFTQMLFFTTASVRALNDEGSWEFLVANVRYQINATGTIYGTVRSRVDVQNGRPGTVIAPGIWSQAVTPGDVWRFWIEVWTEEAWSADADNHATLEVACLFTR